MVATALDSQNRLRIVNWTGSRDIDGHFNYNLTVLVKCTDTLDDPVVVMEASGLPTIGSWWQFGNGINLWAFRTPEIAVQRHRTYTEGEPGIYWTADLKFTTRPLKRCQDNAIQDPLQEPYKISGSFTQATKPVEKDRNGALIKSSSHEIIRGIEKEVNRPTVVIEYNTLTLGLPVFSQMVNKVNDSPLWGLPARCVMLKNVTWSRNIYGTCTFYYTLRFDFEVNYDTFDLKEIADKGYRVLRGHWDTTGPSPDWVTESGVDEDNPKDFMNFKDFRGENNPTPTLLDGHGEPLTDPNAPVFIPTIELADEANFYTLGIPFSLA